MIEALILMGIALATVGVIGLRLMRRHQMQAPRQSGEVRPAHWAALGGGHSQPNAHHDSGSGGGDGGGG